MRTFLFVTGLGTLIAFGIPILVTPIRWARVFQWDIPEDLRLARYFARSLGSVAVAVGVTFVYVSFQAAPPPVFALLGAIAASLLAVAHVVGAIERSQPWTETVEIAFWLALAVWAFIVYHGATTGAA